MAKKKKSTGKLREFADSVEDIGSAFGRNSAIFDTFATKVADAAQHLSEFGSILSKSTGLSEHQVDVAKDVMDAYADMGTAVAKSVKDLKKGKITQEQYNETVTNAYGRLKSLEEQIDDTTDSGKDLKKQVASMTGKMASFGEGAKRSTKFLKAFETGLEGLTGEVPELQKVSDVLKSLTTGKFDAVAASMTALGGAVGAMAYEYGFLGDKIGTTAKWQKDIIGFQTEIDKTIALIELGEDASGNKVADRVNYSAKKAVQNFNNALDVSVAQFQSAAKMARFGKQLGSTGFDIGQLTSAGISADAIASSMTTIARETGRVPSAELATNMALIEKRTGVSSQDIAVFTKTMQMTDNVSEKVSLNLVDGMEALADSAGVDLNIVLSDAAAASKDMLNYNIRSGKELGRQVVAVSSMGVEFSTIANAGRNMVLNYRDSIKSEMKLSSLLGRQVDLSEVRAKFAAGDVAGAAKAFKATGLDPSKMNMFALPELSSAVGGLDTNTMQKLFSGTQADIAELKGTDAKASSENFLAQMQKNLKQLEIATAEIQIRGNVKMMGLEGALQQQVQSAIMTDPKLQEDMHNVERAHFGQRMETGLSQGLFTVGGMLGGNLLAKGGSKLLGKLAPSAGKLIPSAGKLFSKAAPVAAGTGAALAGAASKEVIPKVAEKAAAKVAEKSVAKIATKSIGKAILKKIPLIGLGAGILFGAQRLMEGDFTGAGLELSSGAASLIPGVGTAASLAIDAGLAARDAGAFDSTKTETPQSIAATAQQAATDTKVIANSLKTNGLDERFTEGVLHGINNIDSNTQAIKELTQKIELLAEAQLAYSMGGNVILKIDGKEVSKAVIKSDSKNRGNITNNKNKYDTFYSAI